MWKFIKWTFLLAVLGGGGWLAYQWYEHQPTSAGDAFALIPPDAVFCIVTPDPVQAWREISDSRTWRHLQGNEYFASLTSAANSVDSLVRDNELLFDLIGSREVVMSAHMTGLKQYDFLFLVDLSHASAIKFVNDYVAEFDASGYRVTNEKYNGLDLWTVRDPEANSNLYLSFPDRFLAASYNRTILINALNRSRDTTAVHNAKFREEALRLPAGLLQLYVDYDGLPRFVSAYSNEGKEYLSGLARSLKSTALNVTLDDELLKAEGETLIHDSVQSYVQSLSKSGKGPTEFISIAPQRTAFAMAFGFNSFHEFFENFESNLKEDVSEYASYKSDLGRLENFLGIDLQKNFIDWIGDEVVVLEMQSTGGGEDLETALVIKAKNIEVARENLQLIETKLRRRTPVKFKAVDYRGYHINYLSMKGMFRILFGKFFDRFDKPYFTILNNFVIFSNHPQTLESIIDDYLDDVTLGRSDEFLDFRNEFENQGAVFIYVNTPTLFDALKILADEETRVSMSQNREYIAGFRHIGFQLVPRNNGFKTTLAERFVEPPKAMAEAATDSAEWTVEITGQAATITAPAESDPMALPYIYVRNLSAAEYTSTYSDGATHYTVSLQNGFKNGSYKEYYEDGTLKMKGHFRRDKRHGVWRLFDRDGKLLLRRTYDNGIITAESR